MSQHAKPGTRTEVRRNLRSARYHIAIFLSAAAILIAGGIWRGGSEKGEVPSEAALIDELREEVSGLRVGLSASELDSIQSTMIKAAATVGSAIVAILPLDGEPAPRPISLYSDTHPQNSAPPASAHLSPGISGIVLDPQGYVLTSASVSTLGARVQLKFVDGTAIEGEVLGADSEEFVGLVKASSLPPGILLPDFSKGISDLRTGEWLIRQGRSPSGDESLSLSVLESIRLGAGDRKVGFLDSPAAPEVDGGALIDVEGRIAGMYATPPEAPAFVVPIARALTVANRLKTLPRTPQSWIGIELQDMSEDLRQYFGVKTGALVTQVKLDSPAGKAGLKTMDIVQKIDDMDVDAASTLTTAINSKPHGTTVQLEVRRGLLSLTLDIVTAPFPEPAPNSSADEQTLILKIKETPANGPVILEVAPQALANRLGLMPGDIIKSVNGRVTRRSAELVRLMRSLPADRPRLLQIQRGEQLFFVGIKESVIIP
jgi:serine protease Do